MESSRERLSRSFPASTSPASTSDWIRPGDKDDASAAHEVMRRHSSLAEAREGELIRVTGIVFELVRYRCWKMNIVPGGRYECIARDQDGSVTLVNSSGRRVTLERDVARFICTVTTGARA